jgi:hypothetical protein
VTASAATCTNLGSASSFDSVLFLYQWRQRSGPTIPAFSLGPRLTRQIALSPFSMVPGSFYELEVNVSALPPAAACSIVSPVYLSTLAFQPPVADIAAGANIRVSTTISFVIDGSKSYDPNFSADSPEQEFLSFKWLCFMSIPTRTGRMPCFSGRNSSTALAILAQNTSSLIFPPKILKSTDASGNLYVFQLQVTNILSGLSSIAQEVVSVASFPIPGVSITSSLNGAASLPVSRPFFAVGLVNDPLNSSAFVDVATGLYQCMWQCEAGGFSMSSDNVNLYSDPRFFQ